MFLFVFAPEAGAGDGGGFSSPVALILTLSDSLGRRRNWKSKQTNEVELEELLGSPVDTQESC